MPDLGPYEEPVGFEWDAADRLASALRSLSDLLDEQVPNRKGYASTARTDWKGAFAEQFDGRMDICTGDADRFARALDSTADQVDELARLAREEQHRRDLAKQWKRDHDAWQRERDERDGWSVATDWVSEEIGWGESGEPLPPDPPKSETKYTSEAPPAQGRE